MEKASSAGVMISRWCRNTAALAAVAAIYAAACAVAQEPIKVYMMVPDGTPVHLYLMDDLSSRKSKGGDAIRFKVRESVRVDGIEVIPAGAAAVGHVVAVGRRGFAGHSGRLGLSVDYAVAFNGAEVPLRGEATVMGGSNGASAAAATAPFGPAALLMRGWDTDIRRGTMLNAYVDGEQAVSLNPR
jgi:hypothetical protein